MDKIVKPVILYADKNSKLDLEKLKKKHKIWQIKDIYKSQLIELFNITFPNLKLSSNYSQKLSLFLKSKFKPGNKLHGNWVYFPWSGYLVHMVKEQDYFQLLTNRNKNLITADEQKTLYRTTIGIVGLSVGGSLALSLVHSGTGKSLKLAEKDILETVNLNRVQLGVHQIGTDKLFLLMQRLYETNPYLKIIAYSKGLTSKTLKNYFFATNFVARFRSRVPKPRRIAVAIRRVFL